MPDEDVEPWLPELPLAPPALPVPLLLDELLFDAFPFELLPPALEEPPPFDEFPFELDVPPDELLELSAFDALLFPEPFDPPGAELLFDEFPFELDEPPDELLELPELDELLLLEPFDPLDAELLFPELPVFVAAGAAVRETESAVATNVVKSRIMIHLECSCCYCAAKSLICHYPPAALVGNEPPHVLEFGDHTPHRRNGRPPKPSD